MIRFVVIDNIVCVAQEYTSIFKPEKTVNYYPTGITEHSFEDIYGPIKDQEFYQRPGDYSGRYQFRVKGYNFREWNMLSLPELAKTQAVKQEIIAIQCPKVRTGINTRYRDGRWEKELKKGWCTA